jgi:hypothetical protein
LASPSKSRSDFASGEQDDHGSGGGVMQRMTTDVKPRRLRKWLLLSTTFVTISCCSGLMFQNSFIFGLDPLTRAHGEEMTKVLNHYMRVVDKEQARLHYGHQRETVPMDAEAEEVCDQLAVDEGIRRCTELLTYSDKGEPPKVVTDLRVLIYDSDCTIVAAVFHSAYQTDFLFILHKIDGAWKMADQPGKAVEYCSDSSCKSIHNAFVDKNPPLPFTCDEITSDE